MNDFLHIHLPCGDEGITALEKFLGVKFQEVHLPIVAAEDVEVCPMSNPTNSVEVGS